MIRAYRPGDEDALIALWLASTIPGQPFLPEDHWRAMEAEIRDCLMPIAETWVADEDGELVAFMALLGNLIGGLFTHPRHQGKGYGRALIDHASSRFDPLFVEVFEANERAIGFYRRRGFVDDLRKTDPESGLPQLILRLERRG